MIALWSLVNNFPRFFFLFFSGNFLRFLFELLHESGIWSSESCRRTYRLKKDLYLNQTKFHRATVLLLFTQNHAFVVGKELYLGLKSPFPTLKLHRSRQDHNVLFPACWTRQTNSAHKKYCFCSFVPEFEIIMASTTRTYIFTVISLLS